jgi:hypothetical protein
MERKGKEEKERKTTGRLSLKETPDYSPRLVTNSSHI